MALAVLAIVLPTALIPEAASAHEDVFSVQQVVRVFGAEGIPLHRQAVGETNSRAVSFSSPGRAHLGVIVFEPKGASGTTYDALVVTTGGEFPVVANRGNVEVDWTPPHDARTEAAKVNAALGRLRYSAADARRHPPATISLLPGESRPIHVTPIGTEVDCVHGSTTDSEIIRPTSRTGSTSEYGENDEVATLGWRRVGGAVFTVSCGD